MAESVEFNGAHLKRSVRLPPAIIQRIPLLGGVGVGLFGEFKKGTSVIARLLVGATQFEGLRHPLSHTDAIERLIEAREAKREELRQAEAAEEAARRAAKMENKIDLTLDEATVVPNKHMKPAPLKHLPPYVTVVAPAVSGLEPLEMKVLMSNNDKAPLWLELTVPNVSYLHRLIVKQIQEGSIHNVHPRVRRGLDPVGVAGVSRICNDPKAGSYRYSLKRKGRAIVPAKGTIMRKRSQKTSSSLLNIGLSTRRRHAHMHVLRASALANRLRHPTRACLGSMRMIMLKLPRLLWRR